MRKNGNTRKSAEENRKEWLVHGLLASSLTSGFAGIALSLLATLLSFYVSKSKSPKPIISISHSLLYFVGSIILLGIIIVGIASFMRRKNRDVIVLKQRLAEIYSLAMRKSALNPQLESSTSHD